MVHTAELWIELKDEDMKYISTKTPLNGDIDQITLGLSRYEAITLNVSKGIRKSNRKELLVTPNKYFTKVWRAKLVVDFIKLLGDANITESDIAEICYKLDDYLCNFVVSSGNDLELRRLDYRFDAYIDDEIVRNVLIKLFKKCLTKKHYMVKKATTSKTSVTYSSKSRHNNTYDKEAERKEKEQPIKVYERNILRFEAQILNSHIYYLKKSQGLQKLLENYFFEDMYQKYMRNMIVNTFYQGDYYNFRNASKLINQSVESKTAKKILDFMLNISKLRSVSKAMAVIGKYKYDKYVNILQNVGVNPILIPKEHKIPHIKNPLKPLYNP